MCDLVVELAYGLRVRFRMRYLGWMFAVLLGGAGAVAHAQLPPPSILKEDCTVLKGKAKKDAEERDAYEEMQLVRLPESRKENGVPNTPPSLVHSFGYPVDAD